MKKLFCILIILFVLPINMWALNIYDTDNIQLFDSNDNIRFSIKADHVKIYPKNRSFQNVVISRSGRLYINDEEISLTSLEKDAAVEYFILCDSILSDVKILVKEASKIGIEGAKIGISATTGVLRMLSPFYSAEDFERDVETKASKIEEKAKELEKYGDKIEEKSDKLETMHRRLKLRVDELYELDWF